jgi:hypothetical protein
MRVIASGDLYERQFSSDEAEFAPAPKPEAGIPNFPLASYRYYLRVTDLFEQDGGFTLGFTLLDGTMTNWVIETGLLQTTFRRQKKNLFLSVKQADER